MMIVQLIEVDLEVLAQVEFLVHLLILTAVVAIVDKMVLMED
jgi:hypothetical protein